MPWSSEYLENQRGRLREKFQQQSEALGVSKARGSVATEKARVVFDRGQAAYARAQSSYARHRQQWVRAEFRKLQSKTRIGRHDFKPNWAGRENGLMKQAETNVLNRHKSRLMRIENMTRREIARVSREHSKSRSRTRER